MKFRSGRLALLSFSVTCLLAGFAAAEAVPEPAARIVAHRHLVRVAAPSEFRPGPASELRSADGAVRLAWIFDLAPAGYVAVAADTELPPVVAYSFEGGAWSGPAPENPLLAILRADLRWRLGHAAALPEPAHARLRAAWAEWLDGGREARPADKFQQWPPAGTTPTGGWLDTNWTQGAPYNNLCPTDPVAGGRSLAGCPAVAMAQILNYLETANGTAFSDADDYYHNYAGRQFWIDNDYLTRGFPSWAQLNGYLATLQAHYDGHAALTDTDKAALTWACGAAAHQVYTASGSGTFGVDQALQAYQRFGFTWVELLEPEDPELLVRLSQNMKGAHPAHLAVVTPAWDAGHNVVVDGYNTDNFFHCNFGWGGAYNGWYLLPGGLPYDLTVIEGVVLDITGPPVPGDLNEDGVCDGADAVILAGYLAGSLTPGEGGFTAPSKRADLDGDGVIRPMDLVLLLRL